MLAAATITSYEMCAIGRNRKTAGGSSRKWSLGIALAVAKPDSAVYFMIAEGQIVVLHGFIKKTQKTPVQELQLAQRRKREYEKGYEKE